ncbi:hypothetical protein [Halorussus aquaticus]|uniref:hypothetical protein n=1 Tax=Halorussus aquaticus TaxID=2953748 RepID=UPI003610A6A1
MTDGPHMERPIELEYDTEWNGTRGTLEIEDAWLGEWVLTISLTSSRAPPSLAPSPVILLFVATFRTPAR